MAEKSLTRAEPTAEVLLMQKKEKFDKFKILWCSTAKLSSTAYAELDQNDVSLAFKDLEKYSIEQIKEALAKFRKMPERRLTTAIIESLITGISWLVPAEAWAIAQKTFDDNFSVVLTDEIAEAAGSAKALYLDNQRVAAKEDFIAIYNRLILKANNENKKPRWFLMQTENHFNRSTENKLAIQYALQKGYITQLRAMQLCEYAGIESQATLLNLIKHAPDNETRAKLYGLKNQLVAKK